VRLRGSSRTIKRFAARRYATKPLRFSVSAKVRQALRRASRRRVALGVVSTAPAVRARASS
jgi:hypothetical protein